MTKLNNVISESLMQFVKNAIIDSSYRSDNCMVILEFNLTKFKQSKSYWKHNNSLLVDPTYL